MINFYPLVSTMTLNKIGRLGCGLTGGGLPMQNSGETVGLPVKFPAPKSTWAVSAFIRPEDVNGFETHLFASLVSNWM